MYSDGAGGISTSDNFYYNTTTDALRISGTTSGTPSGRTIAIGFNAGLTQAAGAIAIGAYAGTTQTAASIILNAAGSTAGATTDGGEAGFFVAPVRGATMIDKYVTYNTTTKEIQHISPIVPIFKFGEITGATLDGTTKELTSVTVTPKIAGQLSVISNTGITGTPGHTASSQIIITGGGSTITGTSLTTEVVHSSVHPIVSHLRASVSADTAYTVRLVGSGSTGVNVALAQLSVYTNMV